MRQKLIRGDSWQFNLPSKSELSDEFVLANLKYRSMYKIIRLGQMSIARFATRSCPRTSSYAFLCCFRVVWTFLCCCLTIFWTFLNIPNKFLWQFIARLAKCAVLENLRIKGSVGFWRIFGGFAPSETEAKLRSGGAFGLYRLRSASPPLQTPISKILQSDASQIFILENMSNSLLDDIFWCEMWEILDFDHFEALAQG